jgi:hypothetical protein
VCALSVCAFSAIIVSENFFDMNGKMSQFQVALLCEKGRERKAGWRSNQQPEKNDVEINKLVNIIDKIAIVWYN